MWEQKINLDSPQARRALWQNLRRKCFLRRIYVDWFDLIRQNLSSVPGSLMELGGGLASVEFGFAECLRTDIQPQPGLDFCADARALPVKPGTLSSMILVNVFHHIPDVREFFHQAGQALRPGGRIVMIEPWITPFSRLVYTFLHHEPCRPNVEDWSFTSSGPLSGANEALAWMVFHRDLKVFLRDFPDLAVATLKPIMPLRYILSGGLKPFSFLPGWTYPVVAWMENKFDFFNPYLAMFALVVIERKIPHS